jgi:hypothetical protein
MVRYERARSYSASSEVPSLPGHALFSPPASINPEPAYVAISAASQLISSELETDAVTVSASALTQLNNFLDHILFNILLTAKSTKLSVLKPAIHSVLKPKLGKAALLAADEELQEYLGDDEDEDEDVDPNLDRGPKCEFDLELAWKLARLRCMVYSRLGDLEEDDEDEYIERENLDERGGRPRRFSSHPSRVSTASAIFLTSVIEFLAEQALSHVAQVTQRKLSKSRASQGTPEPTTGLFLPPDRMLVSDADMRHLGRDSPLQKLWRGWRHQVRIPTDPASRPISPESLIPHAHSRKASMNTTDDIPEAEIHHPLSVAEVLHENDPAQIPLPMTDDDIKDVKNVGLSSAPETEHAANLDRSYDNERLRRPRSLEPLPCEVALPTRGSTNDKSGSTPFGSIRPTTQHRKSHSLPTSPVVVPHDTRNDVAAGDVNAEQACQERSEVRDSDRRQEEDDGVPQPAGTSDGLNGGEPGPESVSAAATVMPGAFPHGQTPNETEMGKAVDRSVNGATNGLSKSVVGSSEEVLGRESPLSTLIALGTRGPTNMESAFPFSTHPPRISSKVVTDPASQNELDPSTQVGTASPTPEAASARKRVLPLPRLWEATENTDDVPQERFPVMPITEAQKRQGFVVVSSDPREIKSRTNSKSSHHTQSSSSSSKLLGFDREKQSAIQGNNDRAGVQRIYPTPGDVPHENDQVPRPSTSHSAKEKRPGTAGSHISSLKFGGFGRPSVDTAIGVGGGQQRSMAQDESKPRLSNLIRSEETLKYTLTPQNMREMEVRHFEQLLPEAVLTLIPLQAPDSPRHKTQTQELADFFRNVAPPGSGKTQNLQERRGIPAVEGMNGLRVNPPGSSVVASNTHTPVSAGASKPGKVRQASPASPMAKSVRSQQRARDPQVEKTSTRDLADFAKSTGPEDSGQLPKAVSTVSDQPKRAKSQGPRFQARDPVVKGASSDLIDFIREGPPRGKGDGTHRISRTVAPFRRTMDSDEMSALGPPADLVNRNSGSSNQDGSIVTKSTVNSRTGLMDTTKRAAFNPSNSSNLGSVQVSRPSPAGPSQPKRKQRRVADPYAIDFGSDDEIVGGLGKPPKYEEESLIDFLRNTSPPSESQTQPQPLVFSTPPQTAKTAKKQAEGGFRDRLKRSASTNSLSRNGGARSSPYLQDGSNASTRSGNQLRPSSPHLVQSGSRFDRYKPTQTTYAAHVERNRQQAAAQGMDDDKDESGLSRFFSRKRRVAA